MDIRKRMKQEIEQCLPSQNPEGNYMVLKLNLSVENKYTETELIEPTETNTREERMISIGNGDKEINVTIWGSNDKIHWKRIVTRTIHAKRYETIILREDHHRHVKLTGKTTKRGDTSKVDAFFTYTPII